MKSCRALFLYVPPSTHENKIAYLFLTDKGEADRSDTFARIRDAAVDPHESYILFHQKGPGSDPGPTNAPVYIFTNESLLRLGYIPIVMRIIPGSNHFPVLQFFRDHPGFTYYWVIEDDVRFNGKWEYLFDFFNRYEHDLISSHIKRFRDEPDWNWWNSLSHPSKIIRSEKRIRSFNPIYRISGKALGFIHVALSDKWVGHHEVLLPTLLYHGGFTILDFGGDGDFVSAGNRNRFYTSRTPDTKGSLLYEGTMRYRPAWDTPGSGVNKLYHPVKTAFERRT